MLYARVCAILHYTYCTIRAAALGRYVEVWPGVRACVRVRMPRRRCHAHTHLEGHVGHRLAHLDEALPWAFAQEAQRYVEGRTAPVLE